MKYMLTAIISGVFVLTYIFTGFDFMVKERLVGVTSSLMFIIFLVSILGTIQSFKKTK